MKKWLLIVIIILVSNNLYAAALNTYHPAAFQPPKRPLPIATKPRFAPAPYDWGIFYIGLGIAKDTSILKLLDVVSSVPPGISGNILNANAKLQGIAGRLIGGYEIRFHPYWYLGLEGFGELTDSSGNLSTQNSIFSTSEFWTLRQKFSVGFRLVPGIQISPGILLYATVGYVAAKFNLENNGNFPISVFTVGLNSFQETKSGVAAGLGVAVLFHREFSMRIGWEWRRYQTLGPNFNPDCGCFSVSTATLQHPVQDQFYLDLIYHFTL